MQSPDTLPRVLFNDGRHSVILSQHSVEIAAVDGAHFHVPNHHAWYDRVREASTSVEVRALHEELASMIA